MTHDPTFYQLNRGFGDIGQGNEKYQATVQKMLDQLSMWGVLKPVKLTKEIAIDIIEGIAVNP